MGPVAPNEELGGPSGRRSKCQKCKRTHRLSFYRGITYRDRCECNKGGRKIADEWKLLGYECYKRGSARKGARWSIDDRGPAEEVPIAAASGAVGAAARRRLGACAGYVKGVCALPRPKRVRTPPSRRRRITGRLPRRHRRRFKAGPAVTSPPKEEETKADRNRSNYHHLVNWHLGCRRRTPPNLLLPAASRPSRGMAATTAAADARRHRVDGGVCATQTPEASWPTLDGNRPRNFRKSRERRSRATIRGRSRYSRATGAARSVVDRTFGEETRALLADVAGVDQRATPARMPTKGH